MMRRLFYSDADAVTVAGGGNTSYWLMLYVHSHSLQQHKTAHFAAVALEVLALIVGFALHLRGFALFRRLRAIHANFMLICSGAYTIFILGAVSRMLMIAYEINLLQVSDLSESLIPLLAIMKQASCANANYALWIWTIERACATIFVSDYERKPRLHISLILNAFLFLISYTTGYAIVTRIVDGIIFTLITFTPNIFCALLFRWLLRYNERRLSRLTDQVRRYPDEYSLSLRVQLKENIWSMRKIECGVYLLTIGLVSCMAVVFGPILYFSAPDQFDTLQWFSVTGNLGIAICFLVCAPWIEVAIAIHTGKIPPLLRVLLGRE